MIVEAESPSSVFSKVVSQELSSQAIEIECAKTMAGARIGRQSGLFYVPEVLRLDKVTHRIDFEHVGPLTSISELVKRDDRHLPGVLDQLGCALAEIHKTLQLPDSMMREMPVEWIADAKDNVYIHGDLTTENVFLQRDTRELVILDWSTTRLLGAEYTFGVRYFDLVFFARHLVGALPFKSYFTGRVNDLIDRFLFAYFGAAAENLDLYKLRHYCRLMSSFHWENIWPSVRRRKGHRKIICLLYQVFYYCKWNSYRGKSLGKGSYRSSQSGI